MVAESESKQISITSITLHIFKFVAITKSSNKLSCFIVDHLYLLLVEELRQCESAQALQPPWNRAPQA